MVCKEEICTWFKELSPHKRVDIMCGMLHLCLPLELRFLGSYVEDLAKKDFNHLREAEGKANSRNEMSKFKDADGKAFRSKMAVYLALLHSSNTSCSSVIYELLENHIQNSLSVINGLDGTAIHSILLVLAMAMNHPAFTFHQKGKMFDLYRIVKDMTNQKVKQLMMLWNMEIEVFEASLHMH